MDDNVNNISKLYQQKLSDSEFKKLSSFIMKEYGIKMPPEKRIMLQSRLQKRLKQLNVSSFDEYLKYLFSPQGMNEEVIHMMDVVSTNKTDFFRESNHFDYMLSDVLPQLSKTNRKLKIWSAGCSSGEEAYTIAITINEFKELNPGVDYSIFASDISTKVLNIAASGIYKEERVIDIPLSIKKKYFLRSKNREERKVRVIPALRQKIQCARINLLDLTPVHTPEYQIIFCRNVLIYFERAVQYQILKSLCSNLVPGGYLFLGHSESISGLELPVKSLIPTVFIKT